MFRQMIHHDPATLLLQLVLAAALTGGFLVWNRRRAQATFEVAVALKRAEEEADREAAD